MKRRLIISNERSNNRAWLYAVVYSSRIAVLTVLILFVSFLVQPFHEAIAAEDLPDEPVEESFVADSVKEQSNDALEKEITADETNTAPEQETTEDAEKDRDSEINEEINQEKPNATSSEQTETPNENSEEIGEDSASTTPDVNDAETATSTTATTTNSETNSPDSNTSTTTDETNNPEANEEIGTSEGNPESTEDDLATTTQDETPVIQAEVLINEDNFYQFSKQSCVAVGDGTFHCSSNEASKYDTQSVVFSDLGDSANMEIFLETSDGSLKQITDNDYDDTAPYYDAETLQITWQRLIDGRYQVILYDIAKDKESQLTFSRTNNMEPKVSADGVVWQAWDNNDWEIMYFDGQFTDQITNNTSQDVAPVIQDNYILWSVIGRGDQEAKVYSLKSKEILTISGHDGGIIDNPRFVLVYDTKFDNGDVITQGFDPATGLSEPIAARPAQEPVEIPLTDSTGEIRALIQNKSSFEDEIDVENPQSNNSSSTATTSPTLDLKGNSGDDVKITTATTSADEIFELTEFDLILTETEINFNELEEIDNVIDSNTLDVTSTSTQ